MLIPGYIAAIFPDYTRIKAGFAAQLPFSGCAVQVSQVRERNNRKTAPENPQEQGCPLESNGCPKKPQSQDGEEYAKCGGNDKPFGSGKIRQSQHNSGNGK